LRNMKRVSLLLTLITISLIFAVNVSANSDYYASVQQICTAYQVSRNQFDRIILIGFYAAGKAMTYHSEPIRKVTMVVSVEYKGIQNIVASASKDILVKFVNGEITSSEFVRRVKFD